MVNPMSDTRTAPDGDGERLTVADVDRMIGQVTAIRDRLFSAKEDMERDYKVSWACISLGWARLELDDVLHVLKEREETR